ncbi:hypothetical protein HRbin29_01995 [bacterium HR29]|nr:hypothetical protein HRbin29_01995 [bacterium HR29]
MADAEAKAAGSEGAAVGFYAMRFVAQSAQNVFLAALFLAAGTSARAAVDLSSVFAAILIPAVVLGPLGGAAADRLGPPAAIAVGAAGRLAVAAAAATAMDGAREAWLFAFAYSAVSQVYTPAELTLVRVLRPSQPGRAHADLVALQYGGQGLGMFVLAPLLLFVGGLQAVLLAAAAGLAAHVVLAVLLGYRIRGTAAATSSSPRPAFGFGDVLPFFAAEGRAAYAVLTMAARSLAARAMVIALPAYLAREMGIGPGGLALLFLPGAAGVASGLAWCGRGFRAEALVPAMRLSLVTLAGAALAAAALDLGVTLAARRTPLALLAGVDSGTAITLGVAMLVALATGFALTVSLVAARAVLTTTAPLGQQGRVFAIQEAVSEAVIVLPLLLAGAGAHALGARPVLAAVGVVVLAACLAGELLSARRRLAAAAAPA